MRYIAIISAFVCYFSEIISHRCRLIDFISWPQTSFVRAALSTANGKVAFLVYTIRNFVTFSFNVTKEVDKVTRNVTYNLDRNRRNDLFKNNCKMRFKLVHYVISHSISLNDFSCIDLL